MASTRSCLIWITFRHFRSTTSETTSVLGPSACWSVSRHKRGCGRCDGESPQSLGSLTASLPFAPRRPCLLACLLAFGRRGQDHSKQAGQTRQPLNSISHLAPRVICLETPSGWGTGLSLTSLGRMRATHEELDGELMRWVVLDPATISPAAQEGQRPQGGELVSVCSL